MLFKVMFCIFSTDISKICMLVDIFGINCRLNLGTLPSALSEFI